jgi:hypothetical protein
MARTKIKSAVVLRARCQNALTGFSFMNINKVNNKRKKKRMRRWGEEKNERKTIIFFFVFF